MPSFHIHLVVAKKYMEKNKIINIEDFYNGTIDPDLYQDKKVSHYTIKMPKNPLIPYLENKVILPDYLDAHSDIQTDYEKAFFLHLVTDYLFFNDFLKKNYLEKVSYDQFVCDLYGSYTSIQEYLIQKYDLNMDMFGDTIEQAVAQSKSDRNTIDKPWNRILDIQSLENFMEQVANIDLDSYKKKILINGKNVLP